MTTPGVSVSSSSSAALIPDDTDSDTNHRNLATHFAELKVDKDLVVEEHHTDSVPMSQDDSVAANDLTPRQAFKLWCSFYGRVYPDKKEEDFRFNLFKQSLHRTIPSPPATNFPSFADRTEQESTLLRDFIKQDCYSSVSHQQLRAYKEVAAAANDLTPREYFKFFFLEYEKVYPNKLEEDMRFDLFMQSLDRPVSSLDINIPDFADETKDELERCCDLYWRDICSSVSRKGLKAAIPRHHFQLIQVCDSGTMVGFSFPDEKDFGAPAKKLEVDKDLVAEEHNTDSAPMSQDSVAVNDLTPREAFKLWCHVYGRVYPNKQEEDFRFDLFKQSLDRTIPSTHARNFPSFADRTEQESSVLRDFNKQDCYSSVSRQQLRAYKEVASAAVNDLNPREYFKNFGRVYGKKYLNKPEKDMRFDLFMQSLDRPIPKHAINIPGYADKTEEELILHYGRFFCSSVSRKALKSRIDLKSAPTSSLFEGEEEDTDCVAIDLTLKEAFKIWSCFGQTIYLTKKEEEFRFGLFKRSFNRPFPHHISPEMDYAWYADRTDDEFAVMRDLIGKNCYHSIFLEDIKSTIGLIPSPLPYADPQVNAAAAANIHLNLKEAFATWCRVYQGYYTSDKEEQDRFELFCQSLNRPKPLDNAVNFPHMADRTEEEFKRLITVRTKGACYSSVSLQDLKGHYYLIKRQFTSPSHDDSVENEKDFAPLGEKLKGDGDLVGEEDNTDCVAANDLTPREAFKLWCRFYGRVYPDKQEEDVRFDFFKQSLHRTIPSTHASNFPSFADRTEQESRVLRVFNNQDCYSSVSHQELKAYKEVAAAANDTTPREYFKYFCHGYGKVYPNKLEEDMRFDLFMQSLDRPIPSHAINIPGFADETEEELRGSRVLYGRDLCSSVSRKDLKAGQHLTYPLFVDSYPEATAAIYLTRREAFEIWRKMYGKEYLDEEVDLRFDLFKLSLNRPIPPSSDANFPFIADFTEDELKDFSLSIGEDCYSSVSLERLKFRSYLIFK